MQTRFLVCNSPWGNWLTSGRSAAQSSKKVYCSFPIRPWPLSLPSSQHTVKTDADVLKLGNVLTWFWINCSQSNMAKFAAKTLANKERSLKKPCRHCRDLHWLDKLQQLIKIFFGQSASENHLPLYEWPPKNNWSGNSVLNFSHPAFLKSMTQLVLNCSMLRLFSLNAYYCLDHCFLLIDFEHWA